MKKELTIVEIGKLWFWIGLGLGLLVLLNSLVPNLNSVTEISFKEYTFVQKLLLIFCLFFLMVARASSVMIFFWMIGLWKRKYKRRYLTLNFLNLFVVNTMIYLSLKYNGVIAFMQSWEQGFQEFDFGLNLNLIKALTVSIVPYLIFNNNWNNLQRIYNCKRLYQYNLLACFFVGIIGGLAQTFYF
ncbi:hypothetical protein [Flexithrix dorotheae]|uniref:hypothetical protein n=1 Tax=Flexithrix dorotheae TaxID=70993 RepID=UPI000379E5E8|nr:hypothetical protein [Flexithrix dorotheae]